ncbi:cysteine proteinase [Sistotremastrum niveocremeum HHB9708]|uniref:Ubiquitin carboxyl-terminal hydrolase n=2 Tax=Sistotremastraceae TaxID=3402574 RepID=A0A164T359_9AGAM|nr:cysteine proteinase [Sistotremastrum niveocremeum HHB9708]KZT34016.1 cysteine proteinase [Sistotremastrum suecicum HHB10207 ss-3]
MKIQWIPLESNPEVMNEWAEKAGLDTSQYRLQDVYGLDEELLAFVPQPVKALILIFPDADEHVMKRLAKDSQLDPTGAALDPSLTYVTQTIGNACGTMALLHSLMNSNVPLYPDSPLKRFIAECKGKTPEERAKLLEETDAFASIHLEASLAGQTAAPPAEERPDFHYTSFVLFPSAKADEGTLLVELDGDRGSPIVHGASVDLLQDGAEVIKQQYIGSGATNNFGIIALVPHTEF